MRTVSGDRRQKRVRTHLPGNTNPVCGSSPGKAAFPYTSLSRVEAKMRCRVHLHKNVPMEQPERETWAVTQSAIVHAGSATPHRVALFLAVLSGQIGAGDDPHVNIPSASSLSLSFFRIPDGARSGLASYRRTGLGWRATNLDPDGNQLEQYPLSLVPSPAWWEIHGASASAP
jgi:hypothetical protein